MLVSAEQVLIMRGIIVPVMFAVQHGMSSTPPQVYHEGQEHSSCQFGEDRR